VAVSYNLAVWEGERPSDEDAPSTFERLYAQYLGTRDYLPPTPAIRAYVEALLDRWYELGDERDIDETSPWSDAPLMNNARGPIIYFAMVFSTADEVSAECARMAAERGLVCFDGQWGRLRPTPDEVQEPARH
jgi:hypothetical protein